jgi:phosphopantothenoylcysteine decarboxylase/phosphopantothenate--cysteine ligase
LNWLKIRIFLKQWGKENPSVFGRFALETQNEEENAKGKLEKKNLDMIV